MAAEARSMASHRFSPPAEDAVHQHKIEVVLAQVVPQGGNVIDDVVGGGWPMVARTYDGVVMVC